MTETTLLLNCPDGMVHHWLMNRPPDENTIVISPGKDNALTQYANERTMVCTDASASKAAEFTGAAFIAFHYRTPRTVIPKHPTPEEAQWIAEFEERMSEMMVSVITTRDTDAKHGLLFQQNKILNAANLDKFMSNMEVKDLFKGYPAFCVAAGPSIDTNLSLLGDMASKGVVLVADAAIPIMIKADAEFHIGVTIDPIRAKIKPVSLLNGNTLLFTMLHAFPELLECSPARIFIFPDRSLTCMWAVEESKREWIIVDNVISVAHLMYQAADIMGCEPIILVGNDFALEKTKADKLKCHSRNTISSWGRLENSDKDEWNVGMRGTMQAQGNSGIVTTIGSLAAFSQRMGFMAEKRNGITYNTSLTGLKVRGTTVKSLASILDGMSSNAVELKEKLLKFL